MTSGDSRNGETSSPGSSEVPSSTVRNFDLARYLASSECRDELRATLNAAARRFAARRFALKARVNWRIKHDPPKH